MDEFIRNNADPVWLLQHEMYEELYQWGLERDAEGHGESQSDPARESPKPYYTDDERPF